MELMTGTSSILMSVGAQLSGSAKSRTQPRCGGTRRGSVLGEYLFFWINAGLVKDKNFICSPIKRSYRNAMAVISPYTLVSSTFGQYLTCSVADSISSSPRSIKIDPAINGEAIVG